MVFVIVLTYFYDCFFFNDTATTEIYTLSLHDALPISQRLITRSLSVSFLARFWMPGRSMGERVTGSASTFSKYLATSSDRKSTRLNSSHANISYAVFCLKKKNKHKYAEPYTLSYNHLS